MEYEIKTGDCIDVMKTMPDECVDTIITSPPYWGLRDYGGGGKVWGGDPECNHEWEGYTRPSENTRNNDNSLQLKSAYWEPQEQAFCEHCDAWFGQLGLEPNPEQYVKNMVEVFREARRILKPEGTLWLNLGDSYVGGGRGFQYSKEGTIQKSYNDAGVRYGAPTGKIEGLKPKALVGIPWHVAFALQADGWWLRQDIVWAKPNCMPESVTDRCTKSLEYVFMLTKSKHYYFDHEAIKEPTKGGASTKRPAKEQTFRYGDDDSWAVEGDRDRIMKAKGIAEARTKDYAKRNKRSVWWVGPKPFKEAHFAVFPIELIEPMVLAGCPQDGTVFDPFGGSGTTAVTALKHGRSAIISELNEDYVEIARNRIEGFRREVGIDKTNVEWL